MAARLFRPASCETNWLSRTPASPSALLAWPAVPAAPGGSSFVALSQGAAISGPPKAAASALSACIVGGRRAASFALLRSCCPAWPFWRTPPPAPAAVLLRHAPCAPAARTGSAARRSDRCACRPPSVAATMFRLAERARTSAKKSLTHCSGSGAVAACCSLRALMPTFRAWAASPAASWLKAAACATPGTAPGRPSCCCGSLLCRPCSTLPPAGALVAAADAGASCCSRCCAACLMAALLRRPASCEAAAADAALGCVRALPLSCEAALYACCCGAPCSKSGPAGAAASSPHF
jgi:hypothetical protein